MSGGRFGSLVGLLSLTHSAHSPSESGVAVQDTHFCKPPERPTCSCSTPAIQPMSNTPFMYQWAWLQYNIQWVWLPPTCTFTPSCLSLSLSPSLPLSLSILSILSLSRYSLSLDTLSLSILSLSLSRYSRYFLSILSILSLSHWISSLSLSVPGSLTQSLTLLAKKSNRSKDPHPQTRPHAQTPPLNETTTGRASAATRTIDAERHNDSDRHFAKHNTHTRTHNMVRCMWVQPSFIYVVAQEKTYFNPGCDA